MSMKAIDTLTAQLTGVAPIFGISIGDKTDKSTWRIDFDNAATPAQRTAAQAVLAAFDWNAAETAEATEATAQATLTADSRADAIFTQLRTATPAQISAFVNNQFPAFTATQRQVMKMLLQVAALVLRRGII